MEPQTIRDLIDISVTVAGAFFIIRYFMDAVKTLTADAKEQAEKFAETAERITARCAEVTQRNTEAIESLRRELINPPSRGRHASEARAAPTREPEGSGLGDAAAVSPRDRNLR